MVTRRIPQYGAIAMAICTALSAIPAGEAADTVTTESYRNVPGHTGLMIGTVESNKKPNLSYGLKYRGNGDRLPPGEPAEQHLKRCLAAKPDLDPLDFGYRPAISPDQRRQECIQFLVFWGDYLIAHDGKRLEDERTEAARGLQFLEYAFDLLLSELKSAGVARLADHQKMDLRVTGRPGSDGPRPDLEASLRYQLWVWNTLPESPQDYQVFLRKFRAGEELKRLYGAGAGLGSRESAIAGLTFYEQALHFHQEPLPQCCETAPRILATMKVQMQCVDRAYVAYPGETVYHPARALPRTDLLDAEQLLRRVETLKLMPESELRSRSQELMKLLNRLKIAELEQHLVRARKMGALEEAANSNLQMAVLFKELDDTAKTAVLLGEAAAQYRELGNLKEWAARTIEAASYKLLTSDIQTALAQIVEAKPVLVQTFRADDLSNELRYETYAREKLGMSPPDTEVLQRMADSAQGFPDLKEPDRQKRIGLLRAYLDRSDAPPYLRMIVGMALFRALAEVREFAAAEDVAASLRPELRKWEGISGEATLLEELLDVEANRGNFGRFYATLSEYEALARRLWGENWLGEKGYGIAEILFRLQDYAHAEEMLRRHMEADEVSRVERDYVVCLADGPGVTNSSNAHAEDFLLEARIRFESGRTTEAARIIGQLEKAVGEPSKVVDRPGKTMLLDLAEMDAALGQWKEADAKITRLLPNLEPTEDPNLWARANLQAGKVRLALHQPAAEIAARFENTIPNLTDFPELNAVNAVEMDIWLSDYYRENRDGRQAAAHLTRGLALAQKLGVLDQQIVIERKMGELASNGGDLAGAAGHFRTSMALLKRVSVSIPEDAAKVGYRAERTKAIPLLVETMYQLSKSSASKAQREELFRIIEEGKSRALMEMLSGSPDASATGQNQPVNMEQVRAALGPDGALLEYYASDGESGKVFRILLDRERFQIDLLPITVGDLSAQIQALLDQVREPQLLDEVAFKTRAAVVAAQLLPGTWLPFDSIPYRRLYIVPSGVLYLFPFSLLVDESGRWLGENGRTEIAYLPGASLLDRPPRSFSDAPRSLALVNPALDGDLHDGLSQSGPLREAMSAAFQRWSRGGRLRWEEPVTTDAFLEAAKTLDNVFVYSHAMFDPNQPGNSYIRLSEENGRDPRVTASELLSKGVGHGLWVLAGCSTGVGKVRSGDEVLGLPRALLEAGASMVVISLWDIDSQAALQMMTKFYEKLADGESAAAALREASESLRSQQRSPYEWAPFILIGQYGFAR